MIVFILPFRGRGAFKGVGPMHSRVWLSSAVVETGFYGILFALAPLSLYILLRRPEQSSLASSTYMNKIVSLVCAAQFCATTAVRIDHLVVSMRYMLTTWLQHWILNLMCTSFALSKSKSSPILSAIVQVKLKWILITLQLFLGDCLIVRDLSFEI